MIGLGSDKNDSKISFSIQLGVWQSLPPNCTVQTKILLMINDFKIKNERNELQNHSKKAFFAVEGKHLSPPVNPLTREVCPLPWFSSKANKSRGSRSVRGGWETGGFTIVPDCQIFLYLSQFVKSDITKQIVRRRHCLIEVGERLEVSWAHDAWDRGRSASLPQHLICNLFRNHKHFTRSDDQNGQNLAFSSEAF